MQVVLVCVNTLQHPSPSMKRCLALGRSVGRALAVWPEMQRIVVMGTGGLSHQLDGTRAGFINRDFDQQCLDALISDPEALQHYSVHQLVSLAGKAREILRSYHIPISNTASAVQVLEPRPD